MEDEGGAEAAAKLRLSSTPLHLPPVASAASHPPAADLTCPAEPGALTDAQILADPDGVLENEFNDAVLMAARACRDALARVCEWHRLRGNDEAGRAGWSELAAGPPTHVNRIELPARRLKADRPHRRDQERKVTLNCDMPDGLF